jgi:DNA-binding NtrC family response regulator
VINEARGDAGSQEPLQVPRNRRLDEIIDLVIDATIASERGNLTRAAQQLGVSVRTLQRRAKS